MGCLICSMLGTHIISFEKLRELLFWRGIVKALQGLDMLDVSVEL